MFLAERIHALPEAGVSVSHQLSIGGEPFHGFFFPLGFVAFDVIKDLRLKDEESAVDPAFSELRFFGESGDAVAFDFKQSVSRRRANGGDRCEFAVTSMKGEQFMQVDIADAVAPGDHAGVVADEGLEPFDASAGHGFLPGFHQMHGPVAGWRGVRRNLSAGEVDGEGAAKGCVVGHILLDVFAFVAESDGELGKTEVGVVLHDVQEDGNAADFDHRFGANLCFFRQSGTHATRENAYPDHDCPPWGYPVAKRLMR